MAAQVGPESVVSAHVQCVLVSDWFQGRLCPDEIKTTHNTKTLAHSQMAIIHIKQDGTLDQLASLRCKRGGQAGAKCFQSVPKIR